MALHLASPAGLFDQARFEEALSRIRTALSAQPSKVRTNLWLQVAEAINGIFRGLTQPVTELVYHQAALALAGRDGTDYDLEEAQLVRAIRKQPDVAALLPYIAFLLPPGPQRELLDLFIAEVDARLRGNETTLPDCRTGTGAFLLKAAAVAIALDAASKSAIDPPWWRRSLMDLIARTGGWNGDLSALAMERAAWMAAAASFTNVVARDTTGTLRPSWDEVWELIEPHLRNWFWERGTPSWTRPALARAITMAAAGAGATAEARVAYLASLIGDLGTLQNMQELWKACKAGRAHSSLSLRIKERAAHENAFG